jgi:hypothetical protein
LVYKLSRTLFSGRFIGILHNVQQNSVMLFCITIAKVFIINKIHP